jgi:hypothetical protein
LGIGDLEDDLELIGDGGSEV